MTVAARLCSTPAHLERPFIGGSSSVGMSPHCVQTIVRIWRGYIR
jgi:hypothetical protein